jgi:hypothetical protein
MGEAWIIDAVRTPRAKGKKETGALSGSHPQDLLARRHGHHDHPRADLMRLRVKGRQTP